MRNPDWKREELILALDLYFRLDYGQMHGRNPHIIRLSEELRKLNLHRNVPHPEKFRSINSVSLKLANFKKLDRNFTGRGMRDGARLDREIWDEFYRHRDTLKKEASLVRQLYLKPESDAPSPEIKTFYDSDFLFQIHKNRETDPLIIKLKKESISNDLMPVKCEICGFNPVTLYGEMGSIVMEIHFIKDLKILSKVEISGLEDFVIVCSNCHKILDKNFGLINTDDLKQIIKMK